MTLTLSPDATVLESLAPQAILEWAVDHVPRLAVTASFGADSAVLLHIVSSVAPHLPVLFLETGLHFPETTAYRQELAHRLQLNVVDLHPALTVAEQADRYGPALYAGDPALCCHLRKVAPLERALRSFDGWVTGIRRSQTPARSQAPVVGFEQRAGRRLAKIAPLASWSEDEVNEYLERCHLPRHPLAAQGFRSIGCAPCTVGSSSDADARAGRWPGHARSECGLHEALALNASSLVPADKATLPAHGPSEVFDQRSRT